MLMHPSLHKYVLTNLLCVVQSSRFAQQAWNGRTMNSPLELY